MKRTLKFGSYVWTACGAGWLVLAHVTGLPEAAVVGVGCCAMSGLFSYCSNCWE